MRKELYELLTQLSNMRHPSVQGILKKYGFGYEANIVENLVQEFEDNDRLTYLDYLKRSSSEIG